MSHRGASNMSAAKTGPITLDADQENELREAFDLFDRDGDQSIAAKELHVVMQAIGRNMELSEVQTHIKNIKLEKQAVTSGASADNESLDDDELELNLDEFISFISKEMMDNDVKEELIEAYRKFCGSEDSSTGITKQQLKETMMNYGEKRLTP